MQEYWGGLAFPFPKILDLPDPGVEPGSPALQANFLPSEPPVYNLSICYTYFLLPARSNWNLSLDRQGLLLFLFSVISA